MIQGIAKRFAPARALSILLLAAAVAGAAPLAAKDVYKGFLDPALPHHRAILDTLEKLKASPNDAGLHNDLGCLVAWDGFWRDALREFDTAAKLDKHDSKPFFNAGIVEAWRGNWGSARHAFAKAKNREPGNWPAWWMLGYAEEMLGHDDAAVDAYKTSLRVDTSLFNVAKNPFAASTRLKARVLLETYPKRLVRGGMPAREEFADPDRVASFFQRAPQPKTAAGAAEEAAAAGPAGPVVTSAPSSAVGPGKPTYVPAPSRFSRQRPQDPGAEQAAPPPTPPPDNLPFQNVTPAPPKKHPPQPGPGGAPPEPEL